MLENIKTDLPQFESRVSNRLASAVSVGVKRISAAFSCLLAAASMSAVMPSSSVSSTQAERSRSL
jgi:hypothetical protein